MPPISSGLTSYLFGLLTSDGGLDYHLIAGLQEDGLSSSTESHSVCIQNVSPDLSERSQTVRYPTIYVYCKKLTNSLKEKFATFSGKGHMVIEIRCSRDRIEGLDSMVARYADAVCRVLNDARGSWQDGAYYTGGYEVVFASIKHGGKNFLQSAQISFDVDVSK